MKPSDIQQLVPGFRTINVLVGPCIVGIHEALDVVYTGNKHRYFLSVDLKFKAHQAANVGKPGCYGCTKSEATKDAKALADRIATAYMAMHAARELALRWDTSTNRYTEKLQTERFEKIIAPYTSEFVQ